MFLTNFCLKYGRFSRLCLNNRQIMAFVHLLLSLLLFEIVAFHTLTLTILAIHCLYAYSFASHRLPQARVRHSFKKCAWKSSHKVDYQRSEIKHKIKNEIKTHADKVKDTAKLYKISAYLALANQGTDRQADSYSKGKQFNA